jgi:hypothetical protein
LSWVSAVLSSCSTLECPRRAVALTVPLVPAGHRRGSGIRQGRGRGHFCPIKLLGTGRGVRFREQGGEGGRSPGPALLPPWIVLAFQKVQKCWDRSYGIQKNHHRKT